MKLTLLAAVASAAIISSGVVSHAQENPKHDQRPAAEHAEPNGARAGGAMNCEAPKAAEMQHNGAPKAAEAQHNEAPRAAEAQHNGAPKAAEAQHREEAQHNEAPRAAEAQHKEGSKAAEAQHEAGSKAAEAQHKEGSKAAEAQHDHMQRQGEANAPRHAEAGGKQHEAQRGEGPARITGKVKMSDEHARRVDEVLRREGRPEHVDVSVRVGERIPQTVTIRPLPADVVSLVPEYRGYDYFIDSSDEIVFVSPQSHEIVGTIDYEGRASAEDATRVSAARPCPAND